MKEPHRKRSSESILASSLAGDIARYHLKRRQRYWWAGLLSFEKPMEQDADSIPNGGRQHDNHINRGWIVRSCVVKNPRTLRNNRHENRENLAFGDGGGCFQPVVHFLGAAQRFLHVFADVLGADEVRKFGLLDEP
jgi:hypothetical protein